MSLINVTASGTSVLKTGGCAGCPDASAVSEEQIASSGALEFIAPESGTLRFIGLGSGGIGTGAADINFALRLQTGVAEVREYGSYKTETSFSAGDIRPYIERATFLKLREVSVFYDVPEVWAKQIGPLSTLRVSLSGRNLLTFTGYSGLDPEVSNFGNQPIGRNYDVAPYPPARSYWLSVDAGF